MSQYSRRHNSDDQDDDDYDDQDHIDDLREHIIKSTNKKRKRTTPRLDPKFEEGRRELYRCLQTHEWCQRELEIIRTYYYEIDSSEDCIENCYNHIIRDNMTVGRYTSPREDFFHFHHKNLKKFSKGFNTIQQPEDFRRDLVNNNIIDKFNKKHLEKSKKKLLVSAESANVHVKPNNKVSNYAPPPYLDANNDNYDDNHPIHDDYDMDNNAYAHNEDFTYRFIGNNFDANTLTVVKPTKLSEFSCINVAKSSYNGFFLENGRKSFYLQSDCLAIESNTWCVMETSELSNHNLVNLFLIDYSRNFEDSFDKKPITFIVLGVLHLKEYKDHPSKDKSSKDKPFLLLYVPQYNVAFKECVYWSNHKSIKRKVNDLKRVFTSVFNHDSDSEINKIDIINNANKCVFMNWNGDGFDAIKINLLSSVDWRSQQTGDPHQIVKKNKLIVEIPEKELDFLQISKAKSGGTKNHKKNGKVKNYRDIKMEFATYDQNSLKSQGIYKLRAASEKDIATNLHPDKLIGNHTISIKTLIDFFSNEQLHDSVVIGKLMTKLLEDLRWSFKSDDFCPLNKETFSIAWQSYDIDSFVGIFKLKEAKSTSSKKSDNEDPIDQENENENELTTTNPIHLKHIDSSNSDYMTNAHDMIFGHNKSNDKNQRTYNLKGIVIGSHSDTYQLCKGEWISIKSQSHENELLNIRLQFHSIESYDAKHIVFNALKIVSIWYDKIYNPHSHISMLSYGFDAIEWSIMNVFEIPILTIVYLLQYYDLNVSLETYNGKIRHARGSMATALDEIHDKSISIIVNYSSWIKSIKSSDEVSVQMICGIGTQMEVNINDSNKKGFVALNPIPLQMDQPINKYITEHNRDISTFNILFNALPHKMQPTTVTSNELKTYNRNHPIVLTSNESDSYVSEFHANACNIKRARLQSYNKTVQIFSKDNQKNKGKYTYTDYLKKEVSTKSTFMDVSNMKIKISDRIKYMNDLIANMKTRQNIGRLEVAYDVSKCCDSTANIKYAIAKCFEDLDKISRRAIQVYDFEYLAKYIEYIGLAHLSSIQTLEEAFRQVAPHKLYHEMIDVLFYIDAGLSHMFDGTRSNTKEVFLPRIQYYCARPMFVKSGQELNHVRSKSIESYWNKLSTLLNFNESNKVDYPDIMQRQLLHQNASIHNVGELPVFRSNLKTELSKEQFEAFQFITKDQPNYNIYLTGCAGAGKSYLIEKIVKYYSLIYNYKHHGNEGRVEVLSFTKKAAANVDGKTFHSYLKLKPSEFNGMDNTGNCRYTIDKHVKYLSEEEKNIYDKLVAKLEVIVIDEISMIQGQYINWLDHFLREIKSMKKIPFGGVRILMVGDHFQAGPSYDSSNEGKTDEYLFFFKTNSFIRGNFCAVYLKEQNQRSADPAMLEILNRIRIGAHQEEDLNIINTQWGSNMSKYDIEIACEAIKYSFMDYVDKMVKSQSNSVGYYGDRFGKSGCFNGKYTFAKDKFNSSGENSCDSTMFESWKASQSERGKDATELNTTFSSSIAVIENQEVNSIGESILETFRDKYTFDCTDSNGTSSVTAKDKLLLDETKLLPSVKVSKGAIVSFVCNGIANCKKVIRNNQAMVTTCTSTHILVRCINRDGIEEDIIELQKESIALEDGCQRTQYPIRIGYSMNHFSLQGLTLKSLFVFLGRLRHKFIHKSHGVVYTILGRCGKSEDVFLLSPLLGKEIYVSQDVKDFEDRINKSKFTPLGYGPDNDEATTKNLDGFMFITSAGRNDLFRGQGTVMKSNPQAPRIHDMVTNTSLPQPQRKQSQQQQQQQVSKHQSYQFTPKLVKSKSISVQTIHKQTITTSSEAITLPTPKRIEITTSYGSTFQTTDWWNKLEYLEMSPMPNTIYELPLSSRNTSLKLSFHSACLNILQPTTKANDELINIFLSWYRYYKRINKLCLILPTTFGKVIYEHQKSDKETQLNEANKVNLYINCDELRAEIMNMLRCPQQGQYLLLPINIRNENSRWVLLLVRPHERVMEYYDSSDDLSVAEDQFRMMSKWIKLFDNKDEQWDQKIIQGIPKHTNSIDSGIFVIMYALCLYYKVQMNFNHQNMPAIRKHIINSLLSGLHCQKPMFVDPDPRDSSSYVESGVNKRDLEDQVDSNNKRIRVDNEDKEINIVADEFTE